MQVISVFMRKMGYFVCPKWLVVGNKTFYTNFQTKKIECIAFEDRDVKYLERDVYAFES